MITIPLSKKGKHAGKYETFISDEDADLAELRWQIAIRTNNNTFYVMRKNDKKFNYMTLHRIILERMVGRELLEKEEFVDHIDGNGLNNQRSNLRIATPAQNAANSQIPKNNKSGYKGVHWRDDRNGYVAQIGFNRKRLWIGVFATAEEAYAAYCDKAKELFGEFARL